MHHAELYEILFGQNTVTKLSKALAASQDPFSANVHRVRMFAKDVMEAMRPDQAQLKAVQAQLIKKRGLIGSMDLFRNIIDVVGEESAEITTQQMFEVLKKKKPNTKIDSHGGKPTSRALDDIPETQQYTAFTEAVITGAVLCEFGLYSKKVLS